MRVVPDWWIQTSWWISGIFGTGAVWYFLSEREYSLAVAAGVAAAILAIIAIVLHRKKDTLQSTAASVHQAPVEKDKLVNAEWWDASNLRMEYASRGFTRVRWSNPESVARCEQQGYEIIYSDDVAANVRYRIVNKSGQVLIGKRDAYPSFQGMPREKAASRP